MMSLKQMSIPPKDISFASLAINARIEMISDMSPLLFGRPVRRVSFSPEDLEQLTCMEEALAQEDKAITPERLLYLL